MTPDGRKISFFSKYGNLMIVDILGFFIGCWFGNYRAAKSVKEEVTKKVVEQIEKRVNAIKN